jgi:hypothetical protein
MNPNLSTGYEATRIVRSRLTAQAERGWQVEQAASSRPGIGFVTLCRRVGVRLILASEHLRPAPRGTRHPATNAGSASHR